MERTRAALVFLLVGLVLGCVIGLSLGHGETDVRIERDTIVFREPVAKDSVVVRHVTRYLQVVRHDTLRVGVTDTVEAEENGSQPHLSDDSARVIVPITQKRYETEDYRAYISGFEPRLDSILVFPKTAVSRERQKRWHIGITGGYGFNRRQAEPYIGIGLTYSIISF